MDDSPLWEVCERTGCDSQIQTSADPASDWTKKNNMQTNTDKMKEMCVYFGHKRLQIKQIMMDGINIERVTRTKLLGVMINDKLNWQDHGDLISKKSSQRIYFLWLLKHADKSPSDIIDVYVSIIRSVLEYASDLWHPGLTREQS